MLCPDTLSPHTLPPDTKFCEICKKSIRRVYIKCKCKRNLCKTHVFPQKHDCDFDYKREGRMLLEKNLVSVHPQKIDKI